MSDQMVCVPCVCVCVYVCVCVCCEEGGLWDEIVLTRYAHVAT